MIEGPSPSHMETLLSILSEILDLLILPTTIEMSITHPIPRKSFPTVVWVSTTL